MCGSEAEEQSGSAWPTLMDLTRSWAGQVGRSKVEVGKMVLWLMLRLNNIWELAGGQCT